MFEINEAQLSDIDRVVEMRMEMLYEVGKIAQEGGTEKLRARTRDFFIKKFQTGEFKVLMAVADGKIVATSGIQFLERPPIYENIDGIEAHIMNVYTLPEHRGEGIATALLNNIITQARDKKAGRILLHAIGKDQSIYEKLGFKSTQNEMELVLS